MSWVLGELEEIRQEALLGARWIQILRNRQNFTLTSVVPFRPRPTSALVEGLINKQQR